MAIAFLSDRLKHRFAFTLIPMFVAMAGYGILLNIHGENHHTQYGALFLVTSGCYSAMPVIVCWITMNFGGHRRRSVGTAWTIGFGNSEFYRLLVFSFRRFLLTVLPNSRRNHFHLLFPREGRAPLPSRLYHQFVLPVFLCRSLHTLPLGHLA